MFDLFLSSLILCKQLIFTTYALLYVPPIIISHIDIIFSMLTGQLMVLIFPNFHSLPSTPNLFTFSFLCNYSLSLPVLNRIERKKNRVAKLEGLRKAKTILKSFVKNVYCIILIRYYRAPSIYIA